MGFVLEASYKHDAGVQLLRTPVDIDRFISELLGAGPDYRAATVYAIDESTDADPTHELVVAVDPTRDLGSVRYAGEDGEFYSQGDTTNPDRIVYAYFGTGHEFPANSEITLNSVRLAMVELLSSGGQIPQNIEWQPKESIDLPLS
ncbi:hypothetical protein [Alloactinosynnema sp. L-07]|uniref:Imm1 family immunity protein n=1 Tax=Alloactinosynnema sp. L-07 TaxID=1653480 RepID=UPI00065EF471|nr:Imm1 family immunity protein [Alloactinosynnema sp. L-07]CRK60363.1 hypothetical protein [Alloactinosynnema sp. L-07]